MRVDDSLPDVILTLAILVPLVLFIGLAILSGIGGSGITEATQITQTEGQTVQLDDGALSTEVDAGLTQGNALYFPRANLTAPSGNVTGGNWTVTAYAWLNTTAADTDAAYTVLAVENGTVVLTYDSGDWLGFYNSSSASAVVTVPAPSPADGASLALRWNGTELYLSRDGAATNATALTAAPSARNRSTDWVGRLDEVRAFANAVPTARLDAWHAEPAIPLDQQTRLVRYLFDEGGGSTTRAWFLGTDVGIGSATWTTGVTGPGLTAGQDYRLETGPARITILGGGLAYGAPVVYLTWGSPAARLLADFGDAVTLAGASIVLLIGVYAAMLIQHSRR